MRIADYVRSRTRVRARAPMEECVSRDLGMYLLVDGSFLAIVLSLAPAYTFAVYVQLHYVLGLHHYQLFFK